MQRVSEALGTRPGPLHFKRMLLRVIAAVSGMYDILLGISLLTARPLLVQMFGLPAPTPAIHADLNGLFALAIGVGYWLPFRDPDRYRAYLWLMGPALKGTGAAWFVIDHIVRHSPLAYLWFAAADGTLALVTLWALVSPPSPKRIDPSIPPLFCVTIAIMVTALPLPDAGQSGDPQAALRTAMVETQIAARGVRDERVLAALRAVPRHEFVPEAERRYAYGDHPLPIGHNQTISQPYIVALMTALVRPAATDRALEVGTGSGYQAAVLSRLVAHLHTIELEPELASTARQRLARLGYANVVVRQGDGYDGWPDAAPFDIIVVTAAPEAVPPALLAQLKPGGRMVIPVGPVHDVQNLLLIEKNTTGTTTSRSVIPVRFVPLRRGR